MTLEADTLARACPDVDRRLIDAHAERLDAHYFEAFDLAAIGRHVRLLARLSPEHPVEIWVEPAADGEIECTILAFNYPSEFSLITGLMAGTGFHVESGQVFTYRPASASAPSVPRRRTHRRQAPDLWQRRRIVDFFRGRLSPGLSLAGWSKHFADRLHAVLLLMEAGGEASMKQARHRVNEQVASRLGAMQTALGPGMADALYPVRMDIDNAGPYTRFNVIGQDTPAFLYALSAALALRDIAIEGVSISTVKGAIRDQIDVLDGHGRKIEDANRLNQIRLSVLLTKQFTYFLGQAPDPFTALSRFELLCDDVLGRDDSGPWVDRLSDPRALSGLARLLGASDFIWEDFVRTHYETLAPMLADADDATASSLAERFAAAMAAAVTLEAKQEALNAFKDREIFRIDLHHILQGNGDPRALATSLTQLAETVVQGAVDTVFEALKQRHGAPRTVGGLRARHAVMGLGKFGGEALGYASDIEWLLVYSDNGETNGLEPISNAEFFGRLATESARFIRTKREGIFQVDLRLRPYGNSGPTACSLETFCHYYGPEGDASSYERLALTRLRYICGSLVLGQQIERLRDAFVYERPVLDIHELRRLRERQFAAKSGKCPNAKFSPGALVDLEYYTQILQATHGCVNVRLRTPRMHEALDALSRDGTLTEDEGQRLIEAYYFLRRLINGLRMLRGHAQDLFLPDPESMEYAHLARRMGYGFTAAATEADRRRGLPPAKKLLVDFETQTAVIRAFIERHFGREHLPDPAHGNMADLVLSDAPPPMLAARVLDRLGFRDQDRALYNIRKLAGTGTRCRVFSKIAVLAADALSLGPDPDMALNNWEQFVAILPDPEAHYDLFLRQPRRLDMLLALFAGSQFLADTLARNPDFFDWITDPEKLQTPRSTETIEADIQSFAPLAAVTFDMAIRKFRRREILRIGTRDICLHAPLEEIVADLSLLADAIIRHTLAHLVRDDSTANPTRGFCIMALGKLGGNELNYSSDIDLIALYTVPPDSAGKASDAQRQRVMHWMEHLCRTLSTHTHEGYAYRVDLRLRPYGSASGIVHTCESVLDYYKDAAAPWELQALLKARPIAGDLELGRAFLDAVRPVVCSRLQKVDIVATIGAMRTQSENHDSNKRSDNIKTGRGGIRDVEFLVQGLQLVHLDQRPELWDGHTLQALHRLRTLTLIPHDTAETLREDYVLLRRVEHWLQILEDRQTHHLPNDAAEQNALARRLLGPTGSADRLADHIAQARDRIRAAFESWISGQE